jgi:hypothetical protein
VYIAAAKNRRHHPRRWPFRAALGLLLSLALFPPPAQAGVEFDDCQPTPQGGVTCDTRPTGNTGLDAIDARFGLMEEASPGWNEFDPYEGDDDMFGGNET